MSIFRLSNIEERLNDGEVKTFCKTHDLHGYLEDDENGIPRYRSLLMRNFSTPLSRTCRPRAKPLAEFRLQRRRRL